MINNVFKPFSILPEINYFYVMKHLYTLIGILVTAVLISQNDSTKSLTFSAYAEVYYNYDLGEPDNHERPFFLYNHKRHNEVNLNFMMAKAAYTKDKVRANAAIMFGNYVDYNLAAEPTALKNVYEANIGIKLSTKSNLWLDAGILPSHMGFESAVGADCWTLSRSLCAENSPYYETGLKLAYTNPNEKWNMALYALNGWQRMSRPVGYNYPSFGAQVQFKPNKNLTLNWSNFTGSDRPDSLNSLRFFNDVYAIYDGGRFGFIAGFDIGSDKKDSASYGIWYTPVLILKYKVCKKISIAARSEYFNDNEQILIFTGTPHGFQVLGNSINMDWTISENALFRLEGKYYNATDKLFSTYSKADYNNYSVSASLCFRL